MDLLPCFALILIIALPWWLGPLQLRPISRCPADAPNMRFALIDFASLVLLLTLLAAILKWVFRDQPMGFARAPGLLLLFASLSMMAVAFWGNGTRCLSAHGVHDWRARVVYMLIYPLAYVMPALGLIGLFFLMEALGRQTQDIAGPLFFVLLSPLSWVICSAMSKWVATKATINIHVSSTAGVDLPPPPKEEPFDPFAPDK